MIAVAFGFLKQKSAADNKHQATVFVADDDDTEGILPVRKGAQIVLENVVGVVDVGGRQP